MKKIPARPSKVAGFSILLLVFFIGGNFSLAGTQCSSILSTVPGHSYTCEVESSDQDCTQGVQDCVTGRKCCIAKPAGTTTITSVADCGTPPTGMHYDEQAAVNGDCKLSEPTPTNTTNTTTCDMALTANINAKKNCESLSGTFNITTCTCSGMSTTLANSTNLPEDQNIMGMTIGPKCLLNGQCKFNIYDALGIRTSVRNKGDPTSVGIFVQDIFLSATMFIGTIVTIAIIVSGLMRIFAGASGKDPTKAKSGLLNSLIGLLIIVSSYLIIRLVQYIAKGF